MNIEFVVDTYAAIEYFRGNENYFEAINRADKLYCTEFMLAELYYYYLKEANEETANKYFETFASFIEPINESEIKEAMKLRLKLKKQKLDISYSDAIGYQVAIDKQAKFLTGDAAFEKLPRVEFIK